MANKAPRRKHKKAQPTSVLAMCMTVGFFLGIGLGALMDALLLVIGIGLLAGGAIGFSIDRRNDVPYTRRWRRAR